MDARSRQVLSIYNGFVRQGYAPIGEARDGRKSAVMATARRVHETGGSQTVNHKKVQRIILNGSAQTKTSSVFGKKICVIPDAHDAPNLSNKARFAWIGRWIAEEEPDYVIQLGDIASFDSVTKHAGIGTLEAKGLPTLKDDLHSLHEALDLLGRQIKGLSTKLIITLGNHEHRIWRAENEVPALSGLGSDAFERLLKDHKWQARPYGEIHKIEGVGFVHHAINGIGRAYGGKTAVMRVASDSSLSLVHGHSHVRSGVDVARIGAPLGAIRCVSAGCALPWGHVEDYAKHSNTGWWWGVLSLRVSKGVIFDENWISMQTLSRRYAD